MVSGDVVAVAEEPSGKKSTKRLCFVSFGVTPLLSYRRIQPNRQDAAELSEFSTPAALSSQRLGFRLSASGEFEFADNRFLALGVAYTQYQTSFSYKSNEITRDVALTNDVNEQVNALGLFAAVRYPIKRNADRMQYISLGMDTQLLLSKHNPETGKGLYSVSIGYANDFSFTNGTLRITPAANYSLTRFHYSGVQAQPFWFGVEAVWLFRL